MAENLTYRVFFDTDTDREFMIHPGKFSAREIPAERRSKDKASKVAKTTQSQLRSYLYIMETNTETNQIRYFRNDGKTEVSSVNKVNVSGIKNIDRALMDKEEKTEVKSEPVQAVDKQAVPAPAVKKEQPKAAPETKPVQTQNTQAQAEPKPVQTETKPVSRPANAVVPKVEIPEDLFETTAEFIEICRGIPVMISDLCNSLSREDQAISDILHYIELHDDISPEETASLVASIHAHRVERRKIKDQFDLLVAIRTDISSASGNHLDMPNVTRITKSVMGDRKYRPRIINDMQEEMENHSIPAEQPVTEEAAAPVIPEVKETVVQPVSEALERKKTRRLPRGRRRPL